MKKPGLSRDEHIQTAVKLFQMGEDLRGYVWKFQDVFVAKRPQANQCMSAQKFVYRVTDSLAEDWNQNFKSNENPYTHMYLFNPGQMYWDWVKK